LETTTPYESVSDAYAEIMRDVSDTTRYANVLAAAMETEMERGIL
jgi:hypothetical protein